jgi:hypothetical protein
MILMDPFPDPRSLATDELKSAIKDLAGREQEVSNTRFGLHAQMRRKDCFSVRAY